MADEIVEPGVIQSERSEEKDPRDGNAPDNESTKDKGKVTETKTYGSITLGELQNIPDINKHSFSLNCTVPENANKNKKDIGVDQINPKIEIIQGISGHTGKNYIVFIELTGEKVDAGNISRVLKSKIETAYKSTRTRLNESLKSIRKNFEKIPENLKKAAEEFRKEDITIKQLVENPSFEMANVVEAAFTEILTAYQSAANEFMDNTASDIMSDIKKIREDASRIVVGNVNINTHQGKTDDQIPYLFKIYEIKSKDLSDQMCIFDKHGLKTETERVKQIIILNDFFNCNERKKSTEGTCNNLRYYLSYEDKNGKERLININEVFFLNLKHVANHCTNRSVTAIKDNEKNIRDKLLVSKSDDKTRSNGNRKPSEEKVVSGGFSDDDDLSATSAFDEEFVQNMNGGYMFSATSYSEQNIFDSGNTYNKYGGGNDENASVTQFSATSSLMNPNKNQYGGVYGSETSPYDGSVHMSQFSATSSMNQDKNQHGRRNLYGGNNASETSSYNGSIHMSQFSETSSMNQNKNQYGGVHESETSPYDGSIHMSQFSETSSMNQNKNQHGGVHGSETSPYDGSIHVSQFSETSSAYPGKNRYQRNITSDTSPYDGSINISQYSETSSANNGNRHGNLQMSDTSTFNGSIHMSQFSETSNENNENNENKYKSFSPFANHNMMSNKQKNINKYTLSDSNVMSLSQNSDTSEYNQTNLLFKKEYNMEDLLKLGSIYI